MRENRNSGLLMKNGKSIRGFTLIELLVVVAIITVLMAILLPTLEKARMSARKVANAANLRSIGIASLAYASVNDNWLPDVKNTGYYVDRYDPWPYLVWGEYTTYKVFTSPLALVSDVTFSMRYDGYQNWSWLMIGEPDPVVIAYESWEYSAWGDTSTVWGTRAMKQKINSNIPLGDAFQKMAWNFYDDIPHRLGFSAVLYMDGHVIDTPTTTFDQWLTFMASRQ